MKSTLQEHLTSIIMDILKNFGRNHKHQLKSTVEERKSLTEQKLLEIFLYR